MRATTHTNLILESLRINLMTLKRSESEEDEVDNSSNEILQMNDPPGDEANKKTNTERFLIWTKPDANFVSKKNVFQNRQCKLFSDTHRDMTPLQYFAKVFPPSLFTCTAQCTNERILIYKGEREDNECV